MGLLGGVGLIYVSLVGIVTTVDSVNLVEDVITLAIVLLLLPPLVVGVVVARPHIIGGETVSPAVSRAVADAAIAGGLAGALGGALVLFIELVGEDAVREVFQAATPQLIEILTFERAVAVGVTVLIVLGAAAGALGASLYLLPPRLRRPVVTSLAVALLAAVLQDVVRVSLIQLGLRTDWLYSSRFFGLTYLGVIAMLALGGGAGMAWSARTHVRKPGPSGAIGVAPTRLLVVLATGVGLAVLPLLLGSFLSAVLGRVGLFILLGLGLNIVVGYAGLLDLGYVAFFSVGAYSTAVLTAAENSGSSIYIGLPLFAALPIVVLIAVVTGLLIGGPVLRLGGDYLAIVTLGFGEIARVLVTSDWLKSFLGGAPGLIGIPAPELHIGALDLSFRQPQPFYYLVLGFCLVATFISWRLASSRVGRAWTAMREDEQVAEATGVSTVKYKLLAFAAGAAIGSLGGALFAVQIGSLAPTSFEILVSIQALAILILGGMGSIPGVIVGALVLVGLPGFLSEFEQYRSLIYGAALITIMLYRPQGLLPNVRRTRELQQEELAQDAWAAELGAEPNALGAEEPR
jgi:branched-chain amino acid transport system permease protein